MALSVSRGQSFIVLFIAIVFHRTYPLLDRLGFPWPSFFLPTPWPTADPFSFSFSSCPANSGISEVNRGTVAPESLVSRFGDPEARFVRP